MNLPVVGWQSDLLSGLIAAAAFAVLYRLAGRRWRRGDDGGGQSGAGGLD